jgi:WhiB family transcriptional regulator, redox-sensing transcriptional regulator
VTAAAAAGTRREAILAHLADHPDLTASELVRVVRSGSPVSDLLRDMAAKGQVVRRGGRRPGQAGQVSLWRVAPPGALPPPRPPVPAEVLARKRERDRRATAARRARARPLAAGAASLPGAACVGADPALFFPDLSDHAAERQAVAICARCPVRGECYAAAVTRGERWGIWGGQNLEARRPPVDAARRTPARERTIATMTDRIARSGGRTVSAISPTEWERHMDAGATTYTVGSREPLAVYLDRGEAEAAAARSGGTLVQWDGHRGQQLTAAKREAEPELEAGQ